MHKSSIFFMPIKSHKRHHFDTTAQKGATDKTFLYATLALFVVGFVILSSASMAISYKNHGSIAYYAFHQLISGGVIGLGVLFIFQYIPYRYWKHLALPLIIISFILLALVFIPDLSYISGGARRWFKLGPVNFQPSEVLKFGFIIYLASWLDARRKEVRSISYGVMPFVLMISIIGVFLMMQPDFGTFSLILGTAGIMYFLSGGKISQMGSVFAFGLVALYFLIQLAPYRLTRLLVFFNPSYDIKGVGYQINQASIAIGSGGFWGLGFGRSLQKYNYLPEPMTDSIFAIFAEEIGFIGAVSLVLLFLFFFFRAISIAKKTPDIFGRLLAAGLVISIIMQAFINMSAISGLLPLTGITLPFISYGSTSLVVTMGMAGIILNISKYRA